MVTLMYVLTKFNSLLHCAESVALMKIIAVV